jgi:hypothetical protein
MLQNRDDRIPSCTTLHVPPRHFLLCLQQSTQQQQVYLQASQTGHAAPLQWERPVQVVATQVPAGGHGAGFQQSYTRLRSTP